MFSRKLLQIKSLRTPRDVGTTITSIICVISLSTHTHTPHTHTHSLCACVFVLYMCVFVVIVFLICALIIIIIKKLSVENNDFFKGVHKTFTNTIILYNLIIHI